MRGWLATRSLNQRLGLLALGLAGLALFADVTPGGNVTVHARELLTSVERREDHVMAAELAAWILEGRSGYQLVDLRDEQAFAEYHIPGALNLPLPSVLDGTLARNEQIVVYGEGGIHAAQAWMVLRGKGYRTAYTLLGGLDSWKDEVLFPTAPANPSPGQRAEFERAAQVARYFGGQPRAAAAPGTAPLALPTSPVASAVAVPTLPFGAGGALPKRKKKEGC
jgi:rhodanese-related sulfurtransferase